MTLNEVVAPADCLRDAISVLHPDPRTNVGETLAARQSLIAQYQLNGSVPHAVRVHFETAKNLYLYAWFVYRLYPIAEKHALATLEFALRERLSVWIPQAHGPTAKIPRGLSKLFDRAVSEKLLSNEGLRASERLALRRAEQRASTEAILKMEAQGINAMVVDPSSIRLLPEDYAHDSLKIFGETLPLIRNTYAHGSPMLHPSVLGTFEIVTDLINQLNAQNGY